MPLLSVIVSFKAYDDLVALVAVRQFVDRINPDYSGCPFVHVSASGGSIEMIRSPGSSTIPHDPFLFHKSIQESQCAFIAPPAVDGEDVHERASSIQVADGDMSSARQIKRRPADPMEKPDSGTPLSKAWNEVMTMLALGPDRL